MCIRKVWAEGRGMGGTSKLTHQRFTPPQKPVKYRKVSVCVCVCGKIGWTNFEQFIEFCASVHRIAFSLRKCTPPPPSRIHNLVRHMEQKQYVAHRICTCTCRKAYIHTHRMVHRYYILGSIYICGSIWRRHTNLNPIPFIHVRSTRFHAWMWTWWTRSLMASPHPT